MADILTPGDIEDRAKAAGLSMAEVCRRASVAQSTFVRWKRGITKPSIDVYARWVDIVTVAAAEAEARKPEAA